MLLTLRVSNFLSFQQEIEFSMLSGQVKMMNNHVISLGKNGSDALKAALLYGANASGKSNLLKAVDFVQRVLLRGLKSVITRNLFFRLEKGMETQPSKFEFELKIGDKTYAYGFTVLLAARKISEEWLFEVKKTGDKPIFERTVLGNGKSKMTALPAFRGATAGRFQVYVNDLQDDQLLLQVLQGKEGDAFTLFTSIFNWFAKQLIVFYPESDFRRIGEMLQRGAQKEFSDYLKYFKTGIEEIEVDEELISDIDLSQMEALEPIEVYLDDISPDPNRLSGHERLTKFTINRDGDYVFHHLLGKYRQKGNSDLITLNLGLESDGNRRLLDIIPLLIEMDRGPKTVFIDEIDRSLHPELTRRLLEVFFQKNQQNESQLILTTHESSLLDLALLRRDEIWFVEKNTDGASHLYSLEEFKPRFDTEIRKAYLQGRYGAIPFIADAAQLGW